MALQGQSNVIRHRRVAVPRENQFYFACHSFKKGVQRKENLALITQKYSKALFVDTKALILTVNPSVPD